MIAIVFCFLAFVVTYWAGRRSLGKGLVALLVVGYFYGIVRANLLTMFAHFTFDAGLVGLYLSPHWRKADAKEQRRTSTVKMATILLIAWPALLVVLPFQPLLVTLVGLRGNVFFLPLLLIGSRLKHEDLKELSIGLGVLNLVALGFAGAEYFLGLPRFFPESPVTWIMYSSSDVAGGFFRIPATFISAHAYGGMMVLTLPFLIGCWESVESRTARLAAVLGTGAALMGVLMSATRQNFVLAAAMIIATILTSRLKTRSRVVFMLLVIVMGAVALSNSRFQRFKSLSDTGSVSDRVAGSVNRGLFEMILEYPMGNGLGGGGTSLPYFLASQVRNPIGMESEYARVVCEQGIIGLVLWCAIVVAYFARVKTAFAKGPWTGSRRLMWCMAAFTLLSGFIGLGAFTSIPATVLLLLGMGWTAIPMVRTTPVASSAASRAGYLSPLRNRYSLTYGG